MTLHLNPFYREKGRLVGKHVITIDDFTTHGVSFDVAAALLRKAGAASMTGVAVGKFGNQLTHYDIEINSDPYAPIPKGAYAVTQQSFSGITSSTTQQTLTKLIR